MKKLISVLALITLTLGVVGCDSLRERVIPAAKEKAAEKLTEAIVKTGECQAVGEVRADVNKLLKIESDESMVVKALGSEAPDGSQQEGVVSEICKAAAKLALPVLLDRGAPDDWQCQLTSLNEKVGELAKKACGEIPI